MSATSGHRIDQIEQRPSWRVWLRGRVRERTKERENERVRKEERSECREKERKRLKRRKMLRCTIRRELPSMFPVTRKKKTHAKNMQIHRQVHRETHTEDIPIYRLQFSGDKVKTKKKNVRLTQDILLYVYRSTIEKAMTIVACVEVVDDDDE